MPRNACTVPLSTPRIGPWSVATTGDAGAADVPVGRLAPTTTATAMMSRKHPVRLDIMVVPPEVECPACRMLCRGRSPGQEGARVARRGLRGARRLVHATDLGEQGEAVVHGHRHGQAKLIAKH